MTSIRTIAGEELMLTPAENEVLVRVGPGTPMGRLMRAHWTPVCLLEEVAEPDGPPLLVEALGERYVAFRNTDGELGLLDELCPHRKASLVLGRNEECGLRCLYHGWKFDVKGKVLALASEPEGSPLKDKVQARSYPTTEWGGFVWAWLGDASVVPPFQPPSFALVMNPDSYAELPEDLQALVDSSLQDVSTEIGQTWDKLDSIGKKVLTDAGVNIHSLPDAEMAKLQGVGDTQTSNYIAALEAENKPGESVLAMIKTVTEEVGMIGPGCL